MQIRLKEDLSRDEALMLLEVANAETASLRQQLAEAHQIIAHQAKLNEAAHTLIGVLRAAVTRQVANIERWQETGVPAGPEESKEIYEQLKAALEITP